MLQGRSQSTEWGSAWNKILKSHIPRYELDFKSPLESLEICLTQHIVQFNLARREELFRLDIACSTPSASGVITNLSVTKEILVTRYVQVVLIFDNVLQPLEQTTVCHLCYVMLSQFVIFCPKFVSLPQHGTDLTTPKLLWKWGLEKYLFSTACQAQETKQFTLPSRCRSPIVVPFVFVFSVES